MPIQRKALWALTMLVPAAALAVALADEPQQNVAPPQINNTTIGSHQIDRFEAIRLLQRSLKTDPEKEGDWIILGELAHEVAQDVPSDQDDAYFRMSREAYEKALALDANNAGLKAAVRFAKDQEAHAAEFDQARQNAARTYIESRRREIADSGMMPTVQVYAAQRIAAAPAPGTSPNPPAAVPAAVPPAYPVPVYQPFAPVQGQPYTYNQYARSYMPPNAQAVPPMTVRRSALELPNVLNNNRSPAAPLGRP
jgi:hypothetical protein